MSGFGTNDGERVSRRMRLAAMAGNLYRTGQQAVNDLKEQTRPVIGDGCDGHGRTNIPKAFPDVTIAVQGDEQMVIFPSYAKRHVKSAWGLDGADVQHDSATGIKDETYWRSQWEKNEDEKAIVDVDVRGWIYSPHSGPMNRKSRMLLGLARQLSGVSIPKPTPGQVGSHAFYQEREDIREQERIRAEAAEIERRGQQERQAACRGEYSDRPKPTTYAESGRMHSYSGSPSSSMTGGPISADTDSLRRSATTQSSAGTVDMTEAELKLANKTLMARIAPFMTNPSVSLPVTVFFYNDSESQSRTVITNEAGHFLIRAALSFIPTHVRVLANQDLSTIQEVKITESHGVSLISDVDDTVKHSNIFAGTREIFRNTFVRNLEDLNVDGVSAWYQEMNRLGVSIHYCSNSPWQLFPVLASFFKQTGLPHGSLHLKQYNNMLQGIFEPVAERKKPTLERLLNDFPERRFLLVGDSGEADLEVYTDLATQYPGRVLAIFIRDVTTPERTEFFDNSFQPARANLSVSSLTLNSGSSTSYVRPGSSSSSLGLKKSSTIAVPSRIGDTQNTITEDLIDFSGDTKPSLGQPGYKNNIATNIGQSSESIGPDIARKPPPPRPSKPQTLRSSPCVPSANGSERRVQGQERNTTIPSAPTIKLVAERSHPPSQTQPQISNQSQSSLWSQFPKSNTQGRTPPPPPPSPRRGGTTPSNRSVSSDADSDYLQGQALSSSKSVPAEPLPPLNKKLELWGRRLERAHEQLDGLGVQLYTWRRGQDVVREAVGIVRREQERIYSRKRF